MKNYAAIALVACVAFVTLAATPSHAQALIKADVPFEFSAGYGVLPAGEYTVQRIGGMNTLLISSGQRGIKMVMPRTTDVRTDFETPKLVFHRYGNEYFLAEVWSSSDNAVRKLQVHPRERQLAKVGVPLQFAVVYGVAASAGGN